MQSLITDAKLWYALQRENGLLMPFKQYFKLWHMLFCALAIHRNIWRDISLYNVFRYTHPHTHNAPNWHEPFRTESCLPCRGVICYRACQCKRHPHCGFSLRSQICSFTDAGIKAKVIRLVLPLFIPLRSSYYWGTHGHTHISSLFTRKKKKMTQYFPSEFISLTRCKMGQTRHRIKTTFHCIFFM